MEGYSPCANSPSAWPEPMESVYQALPASGPAPANARRPDIRMADRLFMAAVLAIPRPLRYGAVTWLAEVFGVSRQTAYDTAARIEAGSGNGQSRAPMPTTEPPPDVEADDQTTDIRIPRLILSMLFPGGMPYRPMRVCLREAFSQTRSLGFLSELINRDGDRAGKILAALQWPENPYEIFLSRDETYFSGKPMLLTVDPHSLVIASGHVEQTADGEGWAISLALLLDGHGSCRVRISEDGASFYSKSLTEAKLLLQEAGTDCEFVVQKDIHHIMSAANKVQTALDRSALKALDEVTRHERPSPCKGTTLIDNVAEWREAKKVAESLVALCR